MVSTLKTSYKYPDLRACKSYLGTPCALRLTSPNRLQGQWRRRGKSQILTLPKDDAHQFLQGQSYQTVGLEDGPRWGGGDGVIPFMGVDGVWVPPLQFLAHSCVGSWILQDDQYYGHHCHHCIVEPWDHTVPWCWLIDSLWWLTMQYDWQCSAFRLVSITIDHSSSESS